ncbi:hypothetical protein MC885_003199 [Smutsia gigantea]|nr:hypothetical protein MC885_003199 [Smutsia gigantea]
MRRAQQELVPSWWNLEFSADCWGILHLSGWPGERLAIGLESRAALVAGLDSFYEYLLKSYILFGEKEDLEMFNAAYHSIQNYLRRGREACNEGEGDPPSMSM